MPGQDRSTNFWTIIDAMNKQARRTAGETKGLPHVPPPTLFQQDPEYRHFSGEDEADARKILDFLDPNIKERILRVQRSPTPPPLIAKVAKEQGWNPTTRLRGSFERPAFARENTPGTMWINPHYDKRRPTMQQDTFVHELAHAAGFREDITTLMTNVLEKSDKASLEKLLEILKRRGFPQ